MHGGGCRLHHACVSNHVRVGEVENHHVVLAAFDALDRFVRHLKRTHLRLEVIRRHLRGGNQRAVFAGIRRFHAAVEEERDVRILFGLRNAQLRQPVLRQIRAKRIA